MRVNAVNLGYKLIAMTAVFGAMYSCSSPSNSQNDGVSTTAALGALQASIAALTEEVNALRAEVAGLETRSEACSTETFLAGGCALGALPDDVGMTATFCFSHGVGIDLSAKYGVETALEIEGGAGWPNVGWAEATGKVSFPGGLPSEVAGQAAAGLGRAVDLCLDLPFQPDEAQRAMLADLVRGVNIENGLQAKYTRRANRLLSYAAARIPGDLNPSAAGRSAEQADDSFDVADDAMDRFLADGLQPRTLAADMMSDPIFRDLAASVDLPGPVAAVIDDPQQMLSTLRAVTPATACNSFGLDPTARARFGAINNLCNGIEALPADAMLKQIGSRLTTMQNAVDAIYTGSELRNFICNNVTLSFLSNC
jgi:hypothetical protein